MQTKKIVKLIILQATFLFCNIYVFAQSDNLCQKSTEGTDFWFGFMESRNYNPNHFIEITVTATETTSFQIKTGNSETPFNGTYTVLTDSSVQVEMQLKRKPSFDFYTESEEDCQPFTFEVFSKTDISFINYSERAQNYFWNFDDSLTSIEFEPKHTYTELGDYHVNLLAESVYGCIDTFGIGIKIIPSSVYSPNAFRPDSNIPKNRTFMPVGADVDDSRFNLKIFNRWGEQVFESHSIFNTWNGTVKNGEIAPVGNYVLMANFLIYKVLNTMRKDRFY